MTIINLFFTPYMQACTWASLHTYVYHHSGVGLTVKRSKHFCGFKNKMMLEKEGPFHPPARILPHPVILHTHTHTHTSSFLADRAIREMNRKEKDIVRAYFRAVKYASQIESRVRIMLIGDEESGNFAGFRD